MRRGRVRWAGHFSLANEMLVDAVIRNFEIIGEATKKIRKSIKKKYPDVEWNEAAGFENILKDEVVVINDKPSKKP